MNSPEMMDPAASKPEGQAEAIAPFTGDCKVSVQPAQTAPDPQKVKKLSFIEKMKKGIYTKEDEDELKAAFNKISIEMKAMIAEYRREAKEKI